MAKNKSLPLLQGVSIVDIASEGLAIARYNDWVILTKGAVPGDIADIQLTRRKNKYAEGRVVKLHQPSERRTQPFCKHFGVCGGCKWQNLNYTDQLYFKEKQVKDSLTRIAKFPDAEILPIAASPSEKFYRNKLEFTFSNKKWLNEQELERKLADENLKQQDDPGLGFHIPGLYDKVVDIETCWLMDNSVNTYRNVIKKYGIENKYVFFDIRKQNGELRNLVFRKSGDGEWMIIVVFFHCTKERINQLMQFIRDTFPEISSLYYIINTKKNDSFTDLEPVLYAGKAYISERMDDLRFGTGPLSFFQTNPEQAYKLYSQVKTFADLKGNEVVFDLYTGTGTIAAFLAKACKKVVGIEYIEAAVDDARKNSQLNGIKNTVFFAGDMKDILNREFVALHGKPDVIITDPPRAGMHADVVNQILETGPDKIIYVSCNVATQSRDLDLMRQKYKPVKVMPFDMFPHTHHVETVALLIKHE